ncbi:MAG: hypothetical protein DCF28_10385 [Alphaproteobacteria bacterium]|nr:MAG: hypothetical protein DCF28_10385 [Alphaproteobacteria bacterium]PZO38726.1 MAG: hypothetical protein DCE92_05540 [Alphaproteobacteria bacterium]
MAANPRHCGESVQLTGFFPSTQARVTSSVCALDDGSVRNLTIRQVLASATREVHERLHHHSGLAAVQSGSIDTQGYTRLLARLYGFHEPFEREARLVPTRTAWLENDLAAFGIGPEPLAALPRCGGFPDLSSDEAMLGALYVVEGSALGGVTLARRLEGLVGHGTLDGRSFFSGNGSRTGDAWRAYLLRLSNASRAIEDRATITAAAVATFALFEQWIDGWEDRND